MRQLSEWLIQLDSEQHIVRVAFSLSQHVPSGAVWHTRAKDINRDIIIHWYIIKPKEETEQAALNAIANWCSSGRFA